MRIKVALLNQNFYWLQGFLTCVDLLYNFVIYPLLLSDGNGIWMDFQTKGPAKTQPTSIPLNTSPTPCTFPSPPGKTKANFMLIVITLLLSKSVFSK